MNFKKSGLFVGKFIAYHKGHQYYINKFAANCEKLNLVLCATKNDKVHYSIRKNWLENDLRWGLINQSKKIKLHVSIEDDITPYPNGIKEWCRHIERLVGKVDVMFGNDDYVRECAKEFGAYYYSPDQDRGTFNISSTKIYTNGLKYYDYLAEVSKPYFNKKVLILGPESTGKSTLSKRLATFFDGKYIEEYGRSYEEMMISNFNRRCTTWDIKDYEFIAQRQDEMINDAMEKPSKLIFVDTDALITQMYYELYMKRKASQKIEEIIKSQKFDLIIYLEHRNTDWVADGLRFLPDEDQRQQVADLIKEKLNYYGKDYHILDNSGGYEQRFETAKELIRKTFNI
jgi:HTH-type transcriptional regulator, transcriptional repressor of NAD biosynthesis genes